MYVRTSTFITIHQHRVPAISRWNEPAWSLHAQNHPRDNEAGCYIHACLRGCDWKQNITVKNTKFSLLNSFQKVNQLLINTNLFETDN